MLRLAQYSVLACTLTLVACGRQAMVTQGLAVADSAAPMRVATASGSPDQHVANSLAYEHALSVELQKDSVATRIKEVREACALHKEFACTVLDVSFRAQLEVPSGQVRMRLAPAAVEPMIAEPIADTDRQLSLLSSHRDRLDEFLQRKDLKVDQVISVSKEISTAQTQIDTLRTQRANLQRRVDTELLTIDVSPPIGTYAAEKSPVSDAIRLFGSDFRDAIAQVIRFTATLVPWLVIVLPGVVLLRIFWRAITRWLARREIP
jgi:hypothetical protein